MYDPPGLPPPGWYPDPERPASRRWWNGTEWAAPTWSGRTAASDALPDTGAMVSASFRRAVRRWRALAVLGLVAGAVPSILTTLAIRRVLDGVGVIDEEVVGWSNDRLPAVFALVGAAVVIGWIGSLAIAWLTMCTFDEEIAAQGDDLPALTTGDEMTAAMTALLRAGAILPRALVWLLVGAVVWLAAVALVVGSFFLSIALGVLVVLACIPVGVWLAGKLAFTVQAVVDRPGNPFARSWAVSRDRFWAVFGRVLLAGLIAMIINYGANAVSSLAGSAQTGFGRSPIEVDERGEIEDVRFDELFPVTPLTVAATALGATVSAMFATATVSLAFTELYRTRNPPQA